MPQYINMHFLQELDKLYINITVLNSSHTKQYLGPTFRYCSVTHSCISINRIYLNGVTISERDG